MMTTPNVEYPRVGWELWFRWVGANLVGVVLAGFVWSLVALLMRGLWAGIGGLFVVAGGYVAMLICIFQPQWMVLRRYIPHATKWVVSSLLGGILAGIILLPVIAMSGLAGLGNELVMEAPVLIFTILVLAFLVIGIMQWLVLRRQLSYSSWWILAYIASALIGGVFLFIRLISFEWALLISIILYPIATGSVLIWLLRRPIASSS